MRQTDRCTASDQDSAPRPLQQQRAGRAVRRGWPSQLGETVYEREGLDRWCHVAWGPAISLEHVFRSDGGSTDKDKERTTHTLLLAGMQEGFGLEFHPVVVSWADRVEVDLVPLVSHEYQQAELRRSLQQFHSRIETAQDKVHPLLRLGDSPLRFVQLNVRGVQDGAAARVANVVTWQGAPHLALVSGHRLQIFRIPQVGSSHTFDTYEIVDKGLRLILNLQSAFDKAGCFELCGMDIVDSLMLLALRCEDSTRLVRIDLDKHVFSMQVPKANSVPSTCVFRIDGAPDDIAITGVRLNRGYLEEFLATSHNGIAHYPVQDSSHHNRVVFFEIDNIPRQDPISNADFLHSVTKVIAVAAGSEVREVKLSTAKSGTQDISPGCTVHVNPRMDNIFAVVDRDYVRLMDRFMTPVMDKESNRFAAMMAALRFGNIQQFAWDTSGRSFFVLYQPERVQRQERNVLRVVVPNPLIVNEQREEGKVDVLRSAREMAVLLK